MESSWRMGYALNGFLIQYAYFFSRELGNDLWAWQFGQSPGARFGYRFLRSDGDQEWVGPYDLRVRVLGTPYEDFIPIRPDEHG